MAGTSRALAAADGVPWGVLRFGVTNLIRQYPRSPRTRQAASVSVRPAADRLKHLEPRLAVGGRLVPDLAGDDEERRPVLRRLGREVRLPPLGADRAALIEGEGVFLVVDHDDVADVGRAELL